MPINKVIKEMEDKMHKGVEFVHHELATIRTGKASPALVENITVSYYGTPTRLKELAGISTPEARLIVIQPWDVSITEEVSKEIMKSNLGITPNSDGKIIRIAIPELSEERRTDLKKVIKKMAEDGRVAIRNIRRDANDNLKQMEKISEITEDDFFGTEKDVQKKTDEYICKIDELLRHKEQEIMQV